MAWAESSTSAGKRSSRASGTPLIKSLWSASTGGPGSRACRHSCGTLPTAIEGTDGRLWFAVNDGVVWLDPARASNRTPSPPVSIQSVTADDKVYEMDQRPELPAGTSNIQISYAAVSLLNPEAIRFRYRLRGMEDEWHEAGRSTSVSYRNLPPGSYHFEVGASDANGTWSDKTATADSPSFPRITRPIGFGLSALASSWQCCGWPIGCVSGICSDGSR